MILSKYEDDMYEIIGQALFVDGFTLSQVDSITGSRRFVYLEREIFFAEEDFLALAAQDMAPTEEEREDKWIWRLRTGVCTTRYSSYARIPHEPDFQRGN